MSDDCLRKQLTTAFDSWSTAIANKVDAESADQDMLLARVEKLERTLSSEIDARMDLAQEVRLQATTEPSWTKEQREALKAIMNDKPDKEPARAKTYRDAIERIPDDRIHELILVISNRYLADDGFLCENQMRDVRKIFEAYKRAGKGETSR